MQRYNLFEQVHTTLQDALFIGAQSLRQALALQEKENDTWDNIKATVESCQRLMQAKEATVLPAVDVFEPAIADALLQQHNQAAALAQKLQPLLQKPAEPHLAPLYKQYLCAQLQCLFKSEQMLNPVLWYYYTDKELQQMEPPLKNATRLLADRMMD